MSDDRIDVAVVGLENAAARYTAAVCHRDGAMSDLKWAIRAADRAGVPRLRIAALAKVSRQTVYDEVSRQRGEVQP